MRILLIATCLMVIDVFSYAKDVKYPVKDIPEALRENTHAVVREDDRLFTILSKNRAVFNVRLAVTIFDSKGNHYARERVFYSNLQKVNYLKASVYDADGNQIKKLKNSEIQDVSLYDGTLYHDNRIKKVDLSRGNYPYTVEFEYEVEYKYLYHIDGTYLLTEENTAAQHVTYKLVYPAALKPRYKAINIDQEPKKEILDGGIESLFWSFENIKPVKMEPFGPAWNEVVPHIRVAPSVFQYEGYEGNMESWESYGKWLAQLNENRGELPESARQKVKELTSHLKTNEEKARVLYKYLQSKTRYVNISLGIGGLQPFPASVVDETGYGDCKALSNYMVALLKEAGIKAYYATIMAGEDGAPVIMDLPSHQANHAIVAIPNGVDTIWLECTSQTTPFGYMGTFTGDRKAMLVTEDGGIIVNTIKYPTEKNIQSRTANVYVDVTGDAKATVETHYSGLEYDDLSGILNNQYDDQKKWILRNTGIPSFDVNTFNFKEEKAFVPSADVSINLHLRRLASVSGKRLFLTLNLMNRSTFIPDAEENRETDIVIKYGYIHYDTINYHLPEDIYPEFMPDPVKISSPFGEYESFCKVVQGNVTYIRKMIIRDGRFQPSSYQDFIQFFKEVNKADNMKLVFLNKT